METKRKEYPSTWYDKIYHQDKVKKDRYFLPPEKSNYFMLWSQAVEWIRNIDNPSLFDLGCGTGQFMDLAYRNGIIVTGGIDFSPEAVRMCQDRMPTHAKLFSCQDLNVRPYNWLCPASVITLFEVLEHIKDDLGVLDALPSGQRVIFSVPSYECENHVRIFKTETDVQDRYGELINLVEIVPSRKKHIIWLCRGTKK
jgi:SAM-dependent methyltransferase